MYNRYYYGYDAGLTSAGAILTALLILAMGLLYFIAWCKMFRKADLPWERMFVPIYGQYWMYKIADAAGIFWGFLASGVLYPLFTVLLGTSGSYELMSVLGVVYLIVMLLLLILYSVKLARAFGKGGGFAVGLVLLHPIFVMILGFGSAEYTLGRTQQTAPTGWRCPRCNTLNNPEHPICDRCGYRVF